MFFGQWKRGLSKYCSLLKDDISLTDDTFTKTCDYVRDSDLFSACHQEPLRTTYSRAQTFKNMLKYIEPQKLTLGIDKSIRQRYAYYILLTQTQNTFLEISKIITALLCK